MQLVCMYLFCNFAIFFLATLFYRLSTMIYRLIGCMSGKSWTSKTLSLFWDYSACRCCSQTLGVHWLLPTLTKHNEIDSTGHDVQQTFIVNQNVRKNTNWFKHCFVLTGQFRGECNRIIFLQAPFWEIFRDPFKVLFD